MLSCGMSSSFPRPSVRHTSFVGRARDVFHRFSHRTADFTGSAWAFMLALASIVVWLVTGPLFRFSDTWQLVINTGTTIVTFLMVFLIQNQQNRDAKVMHLKLDELLRAVGRARNDLIDLENCTDEELEKLEAEFHALYLRAYERRGATKVKSR